jgi:hypothetical protein
VAGNGLEVSIWDVERTFAASEEKDESMSTNSKRKKELEEGETWRAKNVSNPFPFFRQRLMIATTKSLAITSTCPSPCFDVSTGIRGCFGDRNQAGYGQEI